jgi:hypothetical protein
MLFNDRRADKRALKAATGPSLAPKGYKPDTKSRQNVKRFATEDINRNLTRWNFMGRKEAYRRGADTQDYYENQPGELKAWNRHAASTGETEISIDVPKNKKKKGK